MNLWGASLHRAIFENLDLVGTGFTGADLKNYILNFTF
ncbi:pentapeptide repeat-containing protein [Pseudomonas piscis]